ncbi:MAG: type II CAAX prenyl endopeptidase Rce1 family protein [Acidobacteriota bacterium]
MGSSRASGAVVFRKGESVPRARLRQDLVELAVGYALILATIWTARPVQAWFYWLALAWIAVTSWISFPGWAALGFRKAGFTRSLWVAIVAVALAIAAHAVAFRIHTLRQPMALRGWVLTFGGYVVWSFVQQFLLQGYFLFRLLRLLPRPEWAGIGAALMFTAAHLPNPILTPLTLIWGTCACFVFLRNRNIYPLAFAHAVLGITVAITVPGPVVRNMRVGLGYLRYHAPHRNHDLPLNPPSPARTTH